MYRVDRNNFYLEQKSSTVFTPISVSRFLFQILHDKIDLIFNVPGLKGHYFYG